MNRLNYMGVVPGLTLGTQLGRSASLREPGVVAACSAAHLFDTIAPGFTPVRMILIRFHYPYPGLDCRVAVGLNQPSGQA